MPDGYGAHLLLDWSAYTRVLLAQRRPATGRRLAAEALRRFEAAVLADELYVCSPFRLEARCSARSAAEFTEISAELEGFRQAPANAETWRLAEGAQQQLAAAAGVSHRVKLPDLLIAALADQQALGVLHFDADYDVLARHTALAFRSEWIAEPGSID